MDAKPIVRTPEEVAAALKKWEGELAHCEQCENCHGETHHLAAVVVVDVLHWLQGEDNNFGNGIKQPQHEQTITE